MFYTLLLNKDKRITKWFADEIIPLCEDKVIMVESKVECFSNGEIDDVITCLITEKDYNKVHDKCKVFYDFIVITNKGTN